MCSDINGMMDVRIPLSRECAVMCRDRTWGGPRAQDPRQGEAGGKIAGRNRTLGIAPRDYLLTRVAGFFVGLKPRLENR